MSARTILDGERVVRAHLTEAADAARRASDSCTADIVLAAELLASIFGAGGKLLLCGNGGSAADCQHVAAELVVRLTAGVERPALAALALTTDSSVITAFANDVGFDGVFARQVQALGRSGDALVAISTSGASRNVIEAVTCARKIGMKVVALTGTGGALGALADVAIRVPASATSHVQEVHLMIEHLLVDLVERHLFGRSQ